jgi:hypothetical protein
VTTTTPAQLAFSAGEISPLLHRRADYQRTQTGLARCNGYLPLRQGGFTRAPGTVFDGYTRNNVKGRLVDFEFAANDAMTLEFTPGKLRFWRYGEPVMVLGVPYEIDTPYGADSLDALQWEQSADVIYLVDGLQPMQKLSRFALDSWTIAPVAHTTGPFRNQNLDKAKTIQASATTGSITLTAAVALFDASFIGVLLQLQPVDFSNIALWTSNTVVAVGDMMRIGNYVYELMAGTNTGDVQPQHIEGTQLVDKTKGTKWRFVDDGIGVVRITAVASGTSATADVLRTVSQACVDDPTYRWAEGAWSARYGYPSCLAAHDQRLIAAATPADPRTFWASAVGNYEDFTPGVEADESFAFAIAGQSSLNRILWIASGGTGLHIGALGEEFSTRSSTQDVVIGPTTTVIGSDSTIGSRAVRPIVPDGAPIFVSKDGRRIFQIVYSFESDRKRPTELSLPADHLGAPGFHEIAWQSAPQRLAWFRRGGGDLVAMLYDRDEDVLGWAPYSLAGGFVESMAVSPSADGSADILTMIVRREIAGETVRMIERQSVIHGLLSDQPIAEANHAFAAAIFEEDPETDSFLVPHLAEQVVWAWTEKGSFGPLQADETGLVTLPATVARATIGLFDQTHQAETLDIQAVAPDGVPMGRRKRLQARTAIGLHRTVQGYVRSIERDFAQDERPGAENLLVPLPVAADLTEAWSGLVIAPVPSGSCTEVALRFRPFGLAPMTVTAVIPPVTENGR